MRTNQDSNGISLGTLGDWYGQNIASEVFVSEISLKYHEMIHMLSHVL